ncbi:MAG: hypothetical protein IPN27_00055 [Cellvibrionales bacterium]|nr:hypothetical protein [Cellvibrionales bacterium]
MTIVLRFFSVVCAFLTAVFLIMPIVTFVYGTHPIGDAIASVVFIFLAFLAMRCTKWLWRQKRFWNEITSFSEVGAFACLILLWPLVSIIELHTSGTEKAIAQLSMLFLALLVYIFIRRGYQTMEKNNGL